MHWINFIIATYASLMLLWVAVAAVEFAKNPTQHMRELKERYKKR